MLPIQRASSNLTDAIGEYSLQDLKDTQAQFNTTDPNAIQIVFQNGTLTLEDGERSDGYES